MGEDILLFLKERGKIVDSVLEKYLPRRIDEKYINRAFGKPRYAYNIEALNKSLSEPIWDFLDRGGKRFRPVLFLLLVEALGGDAEKVKDFCSVLEFLHNGSIMVDDIEDDSDFRRGKETTHKIYGIDIAINAGNFMYFIPFLSYFEHRKDYNSEIMLRAYEATLQEMIRIHAGQGTDIVWHKGMANADNITEKEYLQMCAYKTGVLLRLAARLAVIFTNGSKEMEEKFGRFAEAIGLGFQIQDDILNINPSKEWGKEIGDDINEGKRTLLVIHTLRNANKKDRERLLEILNMHTKDKKLIMEAIEIIKKYGSIEYAKNFAREMISKAWDDVKDMLQEGEAKKRIKALVKFLVEREV